MCIIKPEQEDWLGILLGPVSLAQFISQYWEQEPLHISRTDASHFASILKLEEIEVALGTSGLAFPDVQLTQSGVIIPPRDYTDEHDRILPLRLIKRHREGATIVISRADRLLARLGLFSQIVGKLMRMRSQANAYLSPAGQQGFNPHFDTHDVFVLQVSGRKTFRFYAGGVDLPFNSQQFDPAQHSAGNMHEQISLEPGDTLYIPRGVMHDAVAHDSESSLHVTMGFMPVIVRDLMREMLQIAAEKDVRFRRTVASFLLQGRADSGTGADNCMAPGEADEICTLLRDAITPQNVSTAFSSIKDEFALEAVPDCRTLLRADRAPDVDRLHADTTLVLEADPLLQLECSNGKLIVRSSGQLLEFHEPMSSAVRWLLYAGSAKVSDLPGLTPEQQLALARRLQEQFIVTA